MAPKTDQQLIQRRVYNDAGELLREGLVPLSIKNERQALLEYWAAQDEADAQAAAAEAEAEAARLESLAQEPVNGEAMAIPGLMATVEQQGALLAELDQRTSNLIAAQPEETLRLASQIQLAAGAAQAVEATAQQVQGELMAIAEAAQERLDSLSSEQAAGLGRVADAVEWSRTQIESKAAQVVADAKRQVAQLVTTTTARVADMRGPKGNQGNPGSCTTVGAGVPEGANALMPLIERGAVKGDVYIDGADDNRRAYRWTGEGWEPGPSMATVHVRDVRVQSLSTGNTVFTASAGAGGSGGGMGIDEKLIANRIAPNASICVADASNWSNLPQAEQILSGVLDVSIRPFNGSLGGSSLRVDIPFTWETSALGGDRFTVDGDLGSLDTIVDLTVNVQRGAATAAPGYAGAMPSKTITRVFLQVSPKAGGGGFGTTTMFRLAGDIAWDFEAAGVAITAGQPLPQPLWWWT